MTTISADAPLAMLLRVLKLRPVARHAVEITAIAERDGWTFGHRLRHLIVLELEVRKRRRIERNQRDSDLPGEKTFATLDRNRLRPPWRSSCRRCARARSSTAATTCSCSACPAAAGRTWYARSATS